jgi:hypothetical protein
MCQQLKRGGGGALVLQDAIACELGASALTQSRHELVLRDGLRVGGGGMWF